MRFGHRIVLLAAVPLVVTACAGGDGAPSEITLAGTNAFEFEPVELRAAAGTITIELTAGENSEHTVVVDESGDELVASAAAGETDSGEVDLEAGTYTLYCDVPGHREAGMEATLTVEE